MTDITNKKILWAWLLHNGYVNAAPGYYGGIEIISIDLLDIKTNGARSASEYKPKILNRVTEIGIEWDKTNAPEIDESWEFDGTESPSIRRKIVRGTLVLKNGVEIKCFNKYEVDEYIAVVAYLNGKRLQGVIGDVCRAMKDVVDIEY